LRRSKKGNYICPSCHSGENAHQTGAVKYYADTNTFYCHACGKSGDIFDLVQLTTGKGFAEAFNILVDELGLVIDSNPGRQATQDRPRQTAPQEAKEEPQADYTAYYQECADRLKESKEAIAYLTRRKVLNSALYYGFGFDPAADPANAPGAAADARKPHPCPRIIIPCGKSFYVGRRIDGDNFKAINAPGKISFFNEEMLYAQEVQEVFITEGAFDALSIMEAGGAALGLNSTAQTAELVRRLEERKPSATLILALDNDNPGRKATAALAEDLTRLKIPYILSDICGSCKDPNEAIMQDFYTFYDAVQAAIQEAQEDREERKAQAEREVKELQTRTGAEMVDSFLQAIQSRKYEPIPTGITDIDQAIGGGFMRGQLVLLGAAPGAGKTALSQWIFEGMAARGSTVIFINLEMSRDQLLARSIARLAAKNGEAVKPVDILQGYKWDFTQEAAVMEAAQQYKATVAPRMVYNPESVSADLDSVLQYIEDEAERIEAAGLPAPLVCLDYVQLMTGRDREDEAQITKRAVSSLKAFAIKHNTVVFCIYATNRASNRSGEVTQDSGRGTSALEYSADLQLGLSFNACMGSNGKDAKDLTAEERKEVVLHITKGRFATPGTSVHLFFDGETMTFNQTEWKRTDPGAGREDWKKI
jgi:replicative DNA helicase